MSFQEFLKHNELNKEWKRDLLDTHFEVGNDDDNINSVNREFHVAKSTKPWVHHYNEDDTDEQLQHFYKKRNEGQNFEIKQDVVTEPFGPLEALKQKLMTPDLTSTKKLNMSEDKPMTALEFTRTNFKFGNLEELRNIKSKTGVNFFRPQVCYLPCFQM